MSDYEEFYAGKKSNKDYQSGVTCLDYCLLKPIMSKKHKHVYTPVFSSYSNAFRLFDDYEDMRLILIQGDQNVEYALKFHRYGMNKKCTILRVKNFEDITFQDSDICVNDSFNTITYIPKNYISRRGSKDLKQYIVQYKYVTDTVFTNMELRDLMDENSYIEKYTFIPAIASKLDNTLPDMYVAFDLNDDPIEIKNYDYRSLLPQYEFESNVEHLKGKYVKHTMSEQLKKIPYKNNYIEVNSNFKPSKAFFKILEIFHKEEIPKPGKILFLAEAPGMFIVALTELFKNDFTWKANTYLGDDLSNNNLEYKGLLEDTYGIIKNTQDRWIFGDVASEEVYQKCIQNSYDIVTSDLGMADVEGKKDEELGKFFYAVARIAVGCNAKRVIIKVFLPLKSELSLKALKLLKSKYSCIRYIKTSLNLNTDELYVYAYNSESSESRDRFSHSEDSQQSKLSHSEIMYNLSKIHINSLKYNLKLRYLGTNIYQDELRRLKIFKKTIKWN